MATNLKVTFSASNGVVVERTLRAHWQPALAEDLKNFHAVDVTIDFKQVMIEVLQQSMDKAFLTGVLDELMEKSEVKAKDAQ